MIPVGNYRKFVSDNEDQLPLSIGLPMQKRRVQQVLPVRPETGTTLSASAVDWDGLDVGAGISGASENPVAYASALERENAVLKQMVALALLENLVLEHKLARRRR